MAEEKPFDPTPSRLQKARREGNVARSPEIAAFAAFGLSTLALVAAVPTVAAIARVWLGRAATSPETLDAGAPAIALAGCVAAVVAAAAVGGTAANVIQTRGIAPAPIAFKPDRLDPAQGFKKMFSMQALVSAAKALLAFLCALAFAVPTAQLVFVRGTGTTGMAALAALASIGITRALESALLVAFAFAIVDFIIVRKQWLKKLRMSLYELKKELHENEGDPHLRGRRKQRHRQLLAAPLTDVAKATFVVANPTHVAVGLRYAPPDVGVPLVVVMGAEANALRIRELAADHGIPIVENIPLARWLWDVATVDRPIPRETFVAVAEIVSALGAGERRAS